jgi:3-oxoacyl-[acyl-carrier protein] reductase
MRSGFVAGGSGRVGRAVATRLASFGFAATANYAGPAGAPEVVAGIKAAADEAISAQDDVAKSADVEPLFAGTLEVFGRLDVVVHRAPIMPLFPVPEDGVGRYDKVIVINLVGTRLLLTHAAKQIAVGRRIIASLEKFFDRCYPVMSEMQQSLVLNQS